VHAAALQQLASHVTYLGHSSSLVRVSTTLYPPNATFCPSEAGGFVFRVPTKGRLKQLEEAFVRQSRPTAGMYCGYRRVDPDEATAPPVGDSVFDETIVFSREEGQPVPLRATLHLTSTVRNALMDLASKPSELISGHQANGAPSERPHMAIIPLASIDHFYADGSILGFAVVLPRHLGRFDVRRQEVLRALAGLEQITSRRGEMRVVHWRIRRITGDESRKALRMASYVGPAREWATVTPIVLDRYPKDKDGADERTIIADACVNIGLPRPIRVETSIASPFRGVPPSRHFVSFGKGHPRRGHRIHAVLTFAEPIRGPVILGKNRYLGLGLLRIVRPRRGNAGKE
jgi:CRISPR-associated protein Csb2